MKLSVKDMILVALFAALMVVGAFVKIPFPITPLTFQPFFCALAGILLGSRLGALSMMIYVAMGLAGLPVFSQGGGLLYIFTPSFGYLIGFIASAFVIGKLIERQEKVTLIKLVSSLVIGLVVLYGIGLPYTYLILKFYLSKTNAVFFSATMIPIIIKDLVLYFLIAVTSAGILPSLKKAGLVR
jgi:biotin transport system substrate-specific component